MTFPLWEQSASTLTGLKQSSDADFKARTEKQEEIKSELAAAGITGNSGSFELGDPNYCDNSLDAYTTFGISYDKVSDNWIYIGKMRAFQVLCKQKKLI